MTIQKRSKEAPICLFTPVHDVPAVPRQRQSRMMQLLLGVMSACSLDVEGMQVAAGGSPDRSAPSASTSPQAISPHPPPKLTVWTHEHVNSPEFEALRESAARFNVSQHHYRVELQSSLYRKYDAWLLSAAL